MWQGLLNRITQPFLDFGPLIPKIVIGILIGAILIKVSLLVLSKILKISRIPRSLIDIVISLGAVILWIMLLAELAKVMGLSSVAVTISGSLVVLGFALANGATALTTDIISAFFIAKDRDFNIGNRIKTGDAEGIIDKIDVRKVRITDDEGRRHVIPNANLDKNGWILISRDGQNYKKVEVKKTKKGEK